MGAGPGSQGALGTCWTPRFRSRLKPAPSLTSTFLFRPVSSRQTPTPRALPPHPAPSVPTNRGFNPRRGGPRSSRKKPSRWSPRGFPFLSCSPHSLCPCLGCPAARPVSEPGTLNTPLTLGVSALQGPGREPDGWPHHLPGTFSLLWAWGRNPSPPRSPSSLPLPLLLRPLEANGTGSFPGEKQELAPRKAVVAGATPGRRGSQSTVNEAREDGDADTLFIHRVRNRH